MTNPTAEKVKTYTENTGGTAYKCPSCQRAIPFPYHGNWLFCPLCRHIEPLYDYGISYLFHLHYSEYNCGPGVYDAN